MLLLLLNVWSPLPVNAGVMSGNNYRIQLDNVTSSGKSKDALYNLDTTLDDKSLDSFNLGNESNQNGVRPDISHLTPLVISLSSLLIDFGKLTPTNPIIRSLNISVSHDKSRGYSIIAFQDQPLFSKEKNTSIPNTSCDNGKCDAYESGPWTNTLVYGSGYRCDNKTGTDCAQGFSTTNYFKSFANRAQNENPETVLRATFNSRSNKKQPEAQITYKVNVSGTQQQTPYLNVVTLLAIPYF